MPFCAPRDANSVSKPCLAASRFALHEHQRSAARLRSPDLFVEVLQLAAAAHKRRLGQRGTTVVRADHAGRFVHARVQRGRDSRQVGQYGLGRLIAIPRSLAQQALDELVQGPWNFKAQTPQFGRTRGHVREQELARALAAEGGAARKTLEQYHARRIQIRRFRQVMVERAGLFGRLVAGRLQGVLVAGHQRRKAARQIKIHQDGFGQRRGRLDNHVGGAKVAVQHSAAWASLMR